MSTIHRSPGSEPLPSDLRSAAEQLLRSEGPARAAERLHVSPNTLLRGCAGAPVRRGTVALMRQAMQEAAP